MTDELDDLAVAGRRRMSFQREPYAISPRGIFDDVQPAAKRGILLAAISAFAGRGYHATSTRDIATLAGVSPATIYTYYGTKADLLYDMSFIAHEYVYRLMRNAVEIDADPVTRLERLVRASIRYHAEEHVVARVVLADFRALDVGRLAIIMKLRRACTQLVRDLIEDGMARGLFHVDHVQGATIAILRLVDVSNWYNERGPMSPEELAEVYLVLVKRMLGVGLTAG